MLLELKVNNFAIIENINIQFKQGLNILSGETGAGKSVLLKSLSLLMGFKSSSESIRSGSQQASIEGSFDLHGRKDVRLKLQEQGIEVDEDILVVRRVLSEDKSRVYLNGTLSTLNTLREIVAPLIEVAGHAAPLIEMTGQHESRHLLSKSYHLDILDQCAGTWDLRLKFQDRYERLQKILSEISRLQKDSLAKEQRLDFLRYQEQEIAALNLKASDSIDFEVEIKKLRHTSKLTGFADQAEEVLYNDDDSATARIRSILSKAQDLHQIDPTIGTRLAPLAQAKTLIEDTVYELRTYISKMETDPQKLDELESKLSDLRKLQKKYGPQVSDIFAAFEKITNELKTLESSDEILAGLQKEEAPLRNELLKLGEELHKKRLSGSQTLEKSVNAELLDLNMKGVTFHVQIQAADIVLTGMSDVEFMSKTSPKEPPRPLAKFASGGELSRILLSLKRVIGSSQQPRTYLFDEVDTGVSGETAEKVGKKLKSIANGQQVICVTHLPQVAAYGDAHFFIQKSPTRSPKSSSIVMEVAELQDKNRVQEIARLISGEKISKTSLAHAQQLLHEARP
jgi:DNA repair protein RecN (Recombination protein N)